jgi:hypothetical protein
MVANAKIGLRAVDNLGARIDRRFDGIDAQQHMAKSVNRGAGQLVEALGGFLQRLPLPARRAVRKCEP